MFCRAGNEEELAGLIQRLGSALLLPEGDRPYETP
jgi:hypothetical protein